MAKLKLRMNWTKAGAILVMFIMLFSALAVVADFFVNPEDETSEDEHLGLLNGRDVYKRDEHDYYISDLDLGIELHFRSNPLEAQHIEMRKEALWMIDYLRQGPSGYLAVFYNTTKIAVLMDPEEETRIITAATEITQSLGFTGWQPSLIEAAFTRDSGRADIPVVTEKEAHQSNDTTYFYIYTQPEENTTVIKHFGKIIYVQAPDYDALDLAVDKIKLRMFGYI